MLKIINDQVFHRRAKLEAHSIEAHGLDLKMEQVNLNWLKKKGFTASPRCALNAI